ncbi:nad(p)h-dependent fmn-containing oxidoreductase ywqn-related [Anaeramoeba ignava]|uniref:Nad(P)h-dependent fmn-containing oxidoreductase ywqn-related n=1 Tax=Anaeramoeba ignava TaxID=1746090 RepID=A0A9Q0LK28_ANAIG|nr:nad(p)h-dependent fmn-containing oxidoreductase ywqn-related [Anaeramoeba ignava]|eukprot:Anaeramoba_ignava/a608132_128.p1 GENE.a608132_128~~a608132_128.p1  ORF type:complete len:215 (-),score=54.11 a608132_128:92-709(-)
MEKKAIKVIGFNGSPKARGNTWWMLTKMFDVFKDNGVETELVHIGNKKIHGCMHCMQCVGQGKCTIDTDIVNESVEKIKKSDGMILATPVYFAGPSGQMKLFMDRVAFVAAMNRDKDGHNFLYRKVGAGISVHRRAGGTNTLSQLNYFYGINGSIIPGSKYWNFTVGLNPGDSQNDDEGTKNLVDLADQMVWLMKMIKDNKEKNK